ncbi:MAG: phosphoadenosine phosphosulfate reductase family protein [Bacteroidales bacterium]
MKNTRQKQEKQNKSADIFARYKYYVLLCKYIKQNPYMTKQELLERQSWTLDQKIYHSLEVIDTFLNRLDGKAYVSFSGGKDSTVLLHLCRIVKPDIKAVFCNTRNEYPDIVKFVRKTDNCEIIYPKMKPEEVMFKYGFPLISKEQSSYFHDVRYNPHVFRARRALGQVENNTYGRISKKWLPLTSKKYAITHKCCDALKKEPFKIYEKQNKLMPIVGTMASESNMRMQTYIKRGGCNSFEGKVSSMPLSIWTEKDIWEYIKTRGIEISDIYYKGATRTGCMFCGYGAQYKHDNRFNMALNMYPKLYDKFMNYTNNGTTYREALRDVLKINNLTLPDENK